MHILQKVSVKAVAFNERMCAEQTIPSTSELHTKEVTVGIKSTLLIIMQTKNYIKWWGLGQHSKRTITYKTVL